MTGWPPSLTTGLETATGDDWCEITRIAVGGYTVAAMKAACDAALATAIGTPECALINLGANDLAGLPSQAQWISDYLYVCDALRTKWPDIQVYLMRVWRRGYGADCNTLADWIDDICAERRFVHPGPDERVFLENGDDGVTYTTDGIHPNAAGLVLTAAEWQAVLT